MEELRQISTKEVLELNKHNMKNYIGDHVHIRIMFLLREREVKIASKSLYPNSMEVRFCLQPDTIIELGDVIDSIDLGTNMWLRSIKWKFLSQIFPKIKHNSFLSCQNVKLSLAYFVFYGYEFKM